jgi:hypothetical protein
MATTRKPVTAAWAVVIFLIAVVMVFAVIRVSIDSSNLSSGVVPPEGEFDRRYALQPALAMPTSSPGSSTCCSRHSKSHDASGTDISSCIGASGDSWCRREW